MAAWSADSGAPIASPCIDVCALDDSGYCLGCLRSMDEIAAWPQLDESRRRQLLGLLERRRAGADELGDARRGADSDITG